MTKPKKLKLHKWEDLQKKVLSPERIAAVKAKVLETIKEIDRTIPTPAPEPIHPDLLPPKPELGPWGIPTNWSNVAVSVRRVNRKDKLPMDMGATGYHRKEIPCEGLWITLRDGNQVLVPAGLILSA